MTRDGTPVSTVIPMSAASAQPDPQRADTMRDLQRFMLKSSSTGITQQTVASDLESLNALLPEGGFPTASLVEWVSEQPGLSATTIALNCIRSFLKQPGCLAVIDGHHDFHPLAAQAVGIPLPRMLLIRPGQHATPGLTEQPQATRTNRSRTRRTKPEQADALWALEQSARCPGVRVVLCWLDRVSTTVLRRLQLAVERSGVTVFIMRPAAALQQPSWADLRLQVSLAAVPGGSSQGDTQPNDRAVSVQLLKSRHPVVQRLQPALLKIDHETGAVLTIPELAGSAMADAAPN